jgi:hypothetical protein
VRILITRREAAWAWTVLTVYHNTGHSLSSGFHLRSSAWYLCTSAVKKMFFLPSSIVLHAFAISYEL